MKEHRLEQRKEGDLADRFDEPRRRRRPRAGEWNGTYNRDYGYSYTGDYTRDYDPDYQRPPDPGWRGNYNRDYGYSYTGDRTRDDDADWDRGYDVEPDLAYRSFEPGSYTQEPSQRTVSGWWLITGPYSDVGPRGYRRADDRICEDVCDRLTQHGQIDASDIEVRVDNGEVTLAGMVDSRRTKRMAEDVVESVAGVRDVHNELRVRSQQENQPAGQPQYTETR